MNIFILDKDPVNTAQAHCDKHVGKMLVEGCQMLSTAHRVLDGKHSVVISKGRKKQVWTLGPDLEDKLYKTSHFGHPCTKWVMQSSGNYDWLYNLCRALADEFVFRRGKQHKSAKLLDILSTLPNNIKHNLRMPFALAIKNDPECICESDAYLSYRRYYIKKQYRMKMKWSKREKPSWWIDISPTQYDLNLHMNVTSE